MSLCLPIHSLHISHPNFYIVRCFTHLHICLILAYAMFFKEDAQSCNVFRPKAASITEPAVTTGSLQLLQDVSPTKPIRRKVS